MIWFFIRKKISSDMTTAARDGSLIEVEYGPKQEIALARWSGQGQAFVRDDDPDRKTLHRVTAWRPAPDGQGAVAQVKALTSARAQPVAVSRIVVARNPTKKPARTR